VRLEQLAVVFRPHNGNAGQAFELAVADAVNTGVPAIVDPLREAMKLLGVTDSGPLRMVTVGAEKVPAERQQEFWNVVAEAVGPDAVLRTGRRGRPAYPATTLSRLRASTWQSMKAPAGPPKTTGTRHTASWDAATYCWSAPAG